MTASAKKKISGTLAERADIYELYEESVQAVDVEVEFLQATFHELRGRNPVSFREDFCGTASASCEWVRTSPVRHAVGVDIDATVLDWGRRNRVARLPCSRLSTSSGRVRALTPAAAMPKRCRGGP